MPDLAKGFTFLEPVGSCRGCGCAAAEAPVPSPERPAPSHPADTVGDVQPGAHPDLHPALSRFHGVSVTEPPPPRLWAAHL